MALMSSAHIREEELLAQIRRMEEVQLDRQLHFKNNSTITKKTAPTTSNVTQVAAIKEGTQKIINDWTREVRCYICQQTGHISRDCDAPRKPLKCVICHQEGHTKKYCKTVTQPVVSLVKTNLNKSGYIKMVKINNNPLMIQGLVDTGCDVCLIKASAAKQLTLCVLPTTKQFTVYGNNPINVVNGVTSVTLEVDDVAEMVELWVVENLAQSYDLLIGRIFTDRENVTFIKTKNEVIFGYDYIFKFDDEVFRKMKSARVKVNSDQLLKANDVTIVTASVNEEPVEVLMVNYSASDTKLYKDQEIGGVQAAVRENKEQHGRSPEVITEDLVQYGPKITHSEKKKLVNLINKYRHCFALSMEEIGCTDVLSIEIEDSGPPVMSKPYKTSALERSKIDNIVKEWKRLGFVTETNSSYSSPVLLVTKKDGEPRVVVDYRKLNQQTVKKNFPIANIDEQLEELAGAKLFCVLDLASGYLQVPLTEESKAKTAFITPTKTGQFERMMFGLTNAPFVFSKLMSKVLGQLRGNTAVWYLDDILIPAVSFEDMLVKLESVFKVLGDAHLTLKLKKCHFACEQVDFLGYTLTTDGLQPGSVKMDAILHFPIPKNCHEVRRFLGLTGYFRRFMPHYASKSRAISDLLKKDSKFVWGSEQTTAFKLMKQFLTSKPVLKLYNPNDKTELHCDASAVGLSGILLQQGDDGKMHLVYAVSKKTTATESIYHSTKLELMAIVWSVARLRHLLVNIKFLIVTDCQALIHMITKKTQNPQIARWATLMTKYDYDIQHRSGMKMTHVDATSRASVGEAVDTMHEVIEKQLDVLMVRSQEEEVVAMQHCDSKLVNLINILKLSPEQRTVEQTNLIKPFVLKNNMLYKVCRNKEGAEKELWVVPNCMRKSIIVKYHDLAGHGAVDRTVTKVQENYYFPKMRRYVRYHITCCPECLLHKIPRGKRPGELHPITPGKRPFQILNVDHVGPFIPSSRGNCHVLVMIDNLTKFVKLYAVKNTSTKFLSKYIKSFVLDYSIP